MIAAPPSDRVELGQGAWYVLRRGWLTPDAATRLHADIIKETTWERRPVRNRDGSETTQPRLVGWAGALAYQYSGQTLDPREPHPALLTVWRKVEHACEAAFNHAVLNRYRDGRDHMGLHTDREPQLGEQPLIAAVSVGASRVFRLEWKHRRSRRRTLKLQHGSLLVMGGTLQRHWRHAVPRVSGEVGERINLTFRQLTPLSTLTEDASTPP